MIFSSDNEDIEDIGDMLNPNISACKAISRFKHSEKGSTIVFAN